MKIPFKCLGHDLLLEYDNKSGILEQVTNVKTNKPMMIESRFTSSNYQIKKEKFMIGGESNVCDARYVRIMDMDIFIPHLIFIVNDVD